MTQDMITLGFDRIIEQLQAQAVSQAARRKLAETEPILNEGLCKARMEETTAALRVMEKQEHGEPEQAITLLNMADALEAEMGPEAAAEYTDEYLDRAAELLDRESVPRNGYYAFVCEKCAPVFGHYGYFAVEAELHKRVKEIHESHEGT